MTMKLSSINEELILEQALNALTDRLASEGVTISDANISQWGRYYRDRRLITLRAGMKTGQRLAVLTHEALHHWAFHDGHQEPAVEARINRQVALRLIPMPAYIFAERLHQGNVAGIAAELDLPIWVVQAFQTTLSRAT